MPMPSLFVQIAFGDNPFTGLPSFEDVSPYVRGRLKTNRGRTDRFDEIQAGTAYITLKNTDRRFDPDNTSSPYAPILPMKQIRIGATWDAGPGPVTYPLFTGYVESYTMRYKGAGIAYADLVCVDGFEPLSRLRVGTQDTPVTLAQDIPEDRINDVLDAVGWPSGLRDINSLTTFQIQAADLESTPALEHLQLVARSIDGLFFIDTEGNAVLQGRGYRDGLSSVDTWSDDPTGTDLPYAELETSYDVTQVFNRVEMQNLEGVEQVDEDTTSQSAYLTRTFSRTGLLLVDDADALSIATELVTRYKDPRTRARRMRIDARVRNSWPIVLLREISDKITVNRTTLLGGSALSLDAYIEGIEYDILIDDHDGRHNWDVTWRLSS